MKVTIVDDEIRVGTLIKNLIEWEDLGLEQNGVFQSGYDVLKLFEEDPSDILICDIEMPEMSGLELVEKVLHLHPPTKCVIVSGFRNFEYARQAMQFGVDHYILKPVDEEELNRVLRSLSEISHSEKDKASFERKNLFVAVQSSSWQPMSCEEINRRYGYHLSDGPFFFLRIMSASDRAKEAFISSLVAKLPLYCYDYELYGNRRNSVSVLVNRSAEREQIIHLLYECLADAGGIAKERVCVFAGNEFTDIRELKQESQKMDSAAWERLFLDHSGLVYVKERTDAVPPLALSDTENTQLMKAIEDVNTEGLRELVRSIFLNRRDDLRKNPESVETLVELIFMSSFNKLYNLGVRSDDFALSRDEVIAGLDEIMDFEGLVDFVSGRLVSHVSSKLQIRTDEDSDYIHQAKNYIQNNYNRNISLESLAEELGLNQNYVSSLFKEQTGINFKQYLTDVRMTNAKRLLRETNLNLSQISAEVGYRNAFYFTNNFTSHEGIKPQEYRRLYRRTDK